MVARFTKDMARGWAAEAGIDLETVDLDELTKFIRAKVGEDRPHYNPTHLDEMADRMARKLVPARTLVAADDDQTDEQKEDTRRSRLSGYEVYCDCGEQMREVSPYHFQCYHPENHPECTQGGAPGKLAYTAEDKERWSRIK